MGESRKNHPETPTAYLFACKRLRQRKCLHHASVLPTFSWVGLGFLARSISVCVSHLYLLIYEE